jgi:hypothetical protein
MTGGLDGRGERAYLDVVDVTGQLLLSHHVCVVVGLLRMAR